MVRSMEDKEISNGSITFEFHKGNGVTRASHPSRTALGKPTPSKWDDAQKWLVGLSRGGERNSSKANRPRNSNADDTRLIAPIPHQEHRYSVDGDEEVEKAENEKNVHTKNVDCEEGFWRVNEGVGNASLGVRSVCVRDMGTEMTPIASQEPSRTATPIRATTPAARSPISSGGSTPMRCQHGALGTESYQSPLGRHNGAYRMSNGEEEDNGHKMGESNGLELVKKISPLETRALAWDEAERAKYMARYKREEVKIQAWENHEKRKAEMEMKKLEVKAERLKARAQEKYANKLAAARRIAEEKRANAEAKLNEKAVKTSEKADYIRRMGHLPSTFSFKLPSLCWQ
ncbi:remorin 4.1-like [Chenopodium quinoa]|uniref:Remorin C-terminal domain-containing protein n=1 Tax=Chenopodium quinoa TaxID=63459 RepID=A0A803M6T1_CHEQI|nr:remorin 4.1-like [Chenopodium quinoa]